jgi:hypothetical protein
MQVKVRATKPGFYGNRLHEEGETLNLDHALYYGAWMEPQVDEPENFKAMARAMQAEHREAIKAGREPDYESIEKRYQSGGKGSGAKRSGGRQGQQKAEGAGDLAE